MIGVSWQKSQIETFMDAIGHGKPIHCEWNVYNMLALAGTLRYAAMSHGPHKFKLPNMPPLETYHPEQREAVEEEFQQDLNNAIEFVSQVAMAIKENVYDDYYDPNVQVLVHGDKKVQAVKGFKRASDGSA